VAAEVLEFGDFARWPNRAVRGNSAPRCQLELLVVAPRGFEPGRQFRVLCSLRGVEWGEAVGLLAEDVTVQECWSAAP
jgi:hypothetical protein